MADFKDADGKDVMHGMFYVSVKVARSNERCPQGGIGWDNSWEQGMTAAMQEGDVLGPVLEMDSYGVRFENTRYAYPWWVLKRLPSNRHGSGPSRYRS